jgi:hypothetical protein
MSYDDEDHSFIERLYHRAAILLGLLASLFVVIAILDGYGYWPSWLTDGLSATDFGVLGFLFVLFAAFADLKAHPNGPSLD